MSTISTIFAIVNAIVITFALPLLTFLGVQKFIIQPRYEARMSRRKYATALFFACNELSIHLKMTLQRLNSPSSRVGAAMQMVPNEDFKGNPAWFTKEGYYTTITAHKIAAVSAWLRVYQNALLFSSYPESQSFLKELYDRAQKLKAAFSTGTCLWYYYFDAVGERLIEESGEGASVFRFAKFCAHYANDTDFRLFFEQLHMYIRLLGRKTPKYLDTLPRIEECLQDLIKLLEKKNLLRGFHVERPETAVDELD